MPTKHTPQTYAQLKSLAGSSAKRRAAATIKSLIDKYNERNIGQPIDPSFTALIMIIIRLYDSVKSDPSFVGGYNEAARIIRRSLYNRLNLCSLYKEEENTPEE